ncbi:MAG: hypothetical protein N3E37_01810 [Candidatus Micrarchaeota archaeon]|nr:hypothetical protein [Candidatus Micrarchaeota archaeon]
MKLKEIANKIAKQRIIELINNAENLPEYENYYIDLIMKLKSTHKIKLEWPIRMKFCKHCRHLHKNSRIRIKNKKISIICNKCSKKTEFFKKSNKLLNGVSEI